MPKWPSPGARARCLLFCVQSPGPAKAGDHPYQLRWCSGGSQAATTSDPRAGEGGAVPGGSGGRLAVATCLCGSGRLHVHTQNLLEIYLKLLLLNRNSNLSGNQVSNAGPSLSSCYFILFIYLYNILRG